MDSAKRKKLRALAHRLDPVVHIGKHGLTPAVTEATHEALESHELIKVRFQEHKDERGALTERLADLTGSEVAGTIGHVAILYRQHPDPEKRKIEV